MLFNPVYDNSEKGYGHDRAKEWFPAISPAHIYEGEPHGFFNPPPKGKLENVKDTVLKMDAFLAKHGWLSGEGDEALIEKFGSGDPERIRKVEEKRKRKG